MYFLMLFALPVVIGLVSLFAFKNKLTLVEFFVMEGAVAILLAFGIGIAMWTSTSDTEIISGQILQKKSERVSCSHSYQCHCRTETSGSGKNQTTYEVCDTCYEHSYDVDWNIYTNAMNKYLDIDRIDRQGLEEPPRWTSAYVGEPVAFRHEFTNYIQAAPDSVLNHYNLDPKKYWIPDYPNKTYDYYRLNRFVSIGYSEPHAQDWNYWLHDIAGKVGPTKQAEPIVVAVNSSDTNFAYAIQSRWIGGKKNDVIIVLGVPNYPTISWVRVISWTTREDLKVELRDAIQAIGSMDRRDAVLKEISSQINSKFERMHMRNYKYLMAQIEPGQTATIVLFILSLLLCVGLDVYFINEDPFDSTAIYDEQWRRKPKVWNRKRGF